jgi:hypothetical protein
VAALPHRAAGVAVEAEQSEPADLVAQRPQDLRGDDVDLIGAIQRGAHVGFRVGC